MGGLRAVDIILQDMFGATRRANKKSGQLPASLVSRELTGTSTSVVAKLSIRSDPASPEISQPTWKALHAALPVNLKMGRQAPASVVKRPTPPKRRRKSAVHGRKSGRLGCPFDKFFDAASSGGRQSAVRHLWETSAQQVPDPVSPTSFHQGPVCGHFPGIRPVSETAFLDENDGDRFSHSRLVDANRGNEIVERSGEETVMRRIPT